MHFAEDHVDSPIFIREYTNQFIKTNAAIYTKPIVLFKDQCLDAFLPQSPLELNEQHFIDLVALKPELILLGTGKTQEFPPIALLTPLHKNRIGFEVMTTDAACRTFNLLLSEGRSVLAVLFI